MSIHPLRSFEKLGKDKLRFRAEHLEALIEPLVYPKKIKYIQINNICGCVDIKLK
jgi:hypothetical protein